MNVSFVLERKDQRQTRCRVRENPHDPCAIANRLVVTIQHFGQHLFDGTFQPSVAVEHHVLHTRQAPLLQSDQKHPPAVFSLRSTASTVRMCRWPLISMLTAICTAHLLVAHSAVRFRIMTSASRRDANACDAASKSVTMFEVAVWRKRVPAQHLCQTRHPRRAGPVHMNLRKDWG